MTEPTISTRNLTKRYGERAAVDNLTIDLVPGEVFGLLGPNGAGKTTTILMLLGLTEPTSGSVSVVGLDPARHPLEVKRRVGYMPDAVGFYDTMTGRQNLRYTAHLNRMAGRDARIQDLLETVGLADAADDRVATYSRGMRQRLGVADALVKSPEVLILDEPTTAIDPEGVAEMLDLIRALADEGMTVLLSSHLLHQVQAVCDRVAIFVQGRVAATGSPHELASAGDGPETVEITSQEANVLPEAIARAPFVLDITAARTRGSWQVKVERGSTPSLVEALVAAGVPVDAVRRLGDDLDSVYRRYFHKERIDV
jgi:ABC-2 type transport system ATP-binding protein